MMKILKPSWPLFPTFPSYQFRQLTQNQCHTQLGLTTLHNYCLLIPNS